jgi:replicative superfamily II helicase
MAKYQGAYRSEVGSEEKPYSEELQAQSQPQTSTDDDSWSKRYGDLRRHTQMQMAEKDREVQQMKQQLASATKQQIRFPKSAKEVSEWVKKYPDVASIIDTIAQKRSLEALAMGETKMKGLKKLEGEITRGKAETVLRQMHKDFDKIRANPAFHKNTNDPHAASRAIDLFKADIAKVARNQGAASSVGRTTSAAPSGGNRPRFKESQIEKMSPAEYEKNEDAILESIRRNEFDYDVSGAAR